MSERVQPPIFNLRIRYDGVSDSWIPLTLIDICPSERHTYCRIRQILHTYEHEEAQATSYAMPTNII